MSKGSKSAVGKRKYGFWIIFLGILIAAMATGPDLWAAPGQRAGRNQTIPSGTLTPTPRPPATNPPPQPTNPPPQPTSQATFTPIPTEQVATPTPLASSTVEATVAPTIAVTENPMPPASPDAPDTATPTTVATETQTAVAAETTPTFTSAALPAEETLLSSAATMPAESSGDTGGGSAVVCGGAGLVMAGIILLFVWRLRA